MGQIQTPPPEYKSSTSADDFRGTVISSTITVLAISIAVLAFDLVSTQTGRVVLAAMTVLVFASLVFAYRNQLMPARIITPAAVFLTITFFLLDGDGIHDATVVGYSTVVILAGLLLGKNGVAIFGFITTVAMAGIAYAELNGTLVKQYSALLDIKEASIFWILNLGFSLIVFSLVRRLSKVAESASYNEAVQFELNAELNTLKEGLEQRVDERTQALEEASEQLENRAQQLQAIADVSETVALVKNLKELLPTITQQISRNFDFYHVGIFFLDEAKEYAVFQATNSSGGEKMLGRGHRLAVGQVGLVGSVAQDGKARIALDVGADATYFDNPDLPETRSEMALPLTVGNQIIGVLDVQSRREAVFTEEDTKVFSTLANQVAIAIENARQAEITQAALSEAEEISQQYVRQEWSRVAQQSEKGYRYAGGNVSSLSADDTLKEDENILSFPVKLRGATLGNLKIRTTKGKSELQSEDMDLIEAIVERTALAMENARLLETTSRRAGRERLVSEITTKMRETNDPQVMIQTALDELKEALGASAIQILPRENGKKNTSQ